MLAWTLMASLFHPPHLPAISASLRDLPHAPRSFRLRLGIQGRMQRARHHSSDQFQHRLDDLETPSRSGAFAVFKFSTAPSLRSLHAPFLAHTEVACTWITGEIALFHQDAVRCSGRHHVGHGMPRFDVPSLNRSSVRNLPKPASKMRDIRKTLSRAAGAPRNPAPGANPVFIVS